MKALFLEKSGLPSTRAQKSVALEKLKQGTNPTETYNQQINAYFACLKLDHENEIKTYISGLRDRICKYVWGMNPKTLSYAQEFAFQGEMLEEEEQKEATIVQISHQPHTQSHSSNPASSQPPQRSYSHDPSPNYRTENQALWSCGSRCSICSCK